MPLPIVEPTSTATALHRPRRRTRRSPQRSAAGGGGGIKGADIRFANYTLTRTAPPTYSLERKVWKDGGRMIRTRVASLALCSLLSPILRLVAAQEAAAASSTRTTTYQFTGVVIDAARAPIPEAEVTLIEVGAVRRQVVTGADGRFALGDYPASLLVLRVRRLGYEQRTVDVQLGADGQPTFVEIILAALPVELEEVLVNPTDRGRLPKF